MMQWRAVFIYLVLGTLLLGIIATLFGVFHDKPLSSFHSKLKMSTIVAFLAQGATAMLMSAVGTAFGQLKWKWFLVERNVEELFPPR